jgi:hypothetical protein
VKLRYACVLTQNVECVVMFRFLSYFNLSCCGGIFFIATSVLYLPDFKKIKRIAVTIVHSYVNDIITFIKFTVEKYSRRNVVPFLTC